MINLQNDIKQKIEEIHEGMQNLKLREDFDTLMYKERLTEVESGINKYRDHNDLEGLKRAISIYRETSTFSPEGAPAFDGTIWDANIQVRNKMTILDFLFSELDELVNQE